MSEIPALTDDQQAVVDCTLESRILVTAGPGAGKTHTLVSRIEHMVTSDADVAGQEILSLSFSRAAVGELRRRLSALSSRGSRVRSATFDSFATRLLQNYGETLLDGVDYDRRIGLAIDLIDNVTIDELDEIRHVCVDEAQDLTGVRADFVLKLLKVTNCGFTVFADQAQAIYDFADEAPTGPSFVERLSDAYPTEIVRFSLTTNHRTNDPLLLAVADLGDLIRSTDRDGEYVIAAFDRAVRGLPAAGSIEDAAFMLQGAISTAILTRRNSEALAVSAALYAAGVAHQFRRRADDPVIGGWLSRLSDSVGSRRITIETLEELAPILPWNPNTTWAAMSTIARPRKGLLNLDELADALAERIPPDELLDSRSDGVIVSSIHRAKGLEFNTVLIAPFEIPDDGWLQEARVLYVGLTRAKHNLMTLKRVDDGRWGYVPGANRWRRIGFAGKQRYTTGVEISGLDATTFDATGAARPRRDPSEVIGYLLTTVAEGDSVTLERRGLDATDCVYDVTHEGQWLAGTTPRFGEVITRRLGLKSPPARIEGCRVEAVATTALPASVAEYMEIRDRLVPNCRIQGVGTW